MLTQIESPRGNTLVYELDGYVSVEDISYIEEGIKFKSSKYDVVNLMIYINAKGEGFDTLLKEFELGIKYANLIHKIAFISDKDYWNLFVYIDNLSTGYKERYFDIDSVAKAWDWIDQD